MTEGGWHEQHHPDFKQCPRKKPKRQDWKPLSDYSFSHTSPWAQKIMSTWGLVPEVCCACQKALAVLKQSEVVEANVQFSVLRLKQGASPQLIKIICLFGVMQVSCGNWGAKLKGACVTGVLHSDFGKLLPPVHTILPGHPHQCMLSELLSPTVMWSLIYSVGKIQPWWPFWWEIILVLTLPSCVQDSNTKLPALFPCLVPFSVCQFHLNLLSGRCFLPWESIFSCSLPCCGAETPSLEAGVFVFNIFIFLWDIPFILS